MYAAHRLQDFVNSTCKFNSIVVKMPKLVLCFSRDGVFLKIKTKVKRSYSSSVCIVWAHFRPTLHLAGHFNAVRRKLLRLGWKFRVATFLYLKKYHLSCFDFLSRNVKKLLTILSFLFWKVYNSAQFQNMLSNNFLCCSLMSQELIAVGIVQLYLIFIKLWYQM
jgi:hypothetical protein